MNSQIHIETIPTKKLSKADYQAIVDLCSRAYDEAYAPYLKAFSDSRHILGKVDGVLVSHALWITRWMQIEAGPLLRTAYVEGVATEGAHHGQGFATAIMKRLSNEIQDYDIGGLSPAETSLYTRLGWDFWKGPLFHRKDGRLIPDPEEEMMVLRLPNTPKIDIHAPISIEWREGEVW